ncbi:glycine zipper 2TM domain-containing protein [Rugamonas sp.]|uniref:glycine zipper 2TM domain-containing protein n=1 Tax=Rugamonas sp. TaxID=1926287 RepID=UPI0025DA18AE|nr:glycine zipper 2TM domain-containing protein [Rugamonas sp.]
MNTISPSGRSAPHPILIIAAVAIVLFCGVGTAAIMGWLPSSIGGNHSGVAVTTDQAGTGNAAVDANTAAPAASAALSQTAPASGQSTASGNNVPMQPQDSQPSRVAAVCHSCGVVTSVREITTRGQGSGAGAAGGAILGGLLGNQVGSGHGRQLATVAGAIGGAVAGNQVEGNMNAHHSYEITVRMEDGSHRTLHRTTAPEWRSGDAVRIVNGDIRANG